MRRSQRGFAAVALMALLAAAASTAHAGVVFKLETTYQSGSESQVEESQLFVLSPNLKMGIMTGSASSKGEIPDEMIFRGDRKQMIVVQHSEKTYLVIDPETMEKISSQMPKADAEMQQAMKDMQKQMAELSPEQRKMMEKMLKDKMPPGAAVGSERPRPEFRKTHEEKTIDGYPCVRYDVYLGKDKTQELWVTDWKNIKGSKELMSVFKDMSDFYAQMMKSLDKMAGGLLSPERNPMEDLASIDGFPVVTRNYADGKLESETVLKSVAERDLDPADFEAPKGYKLQTMGPE
jgi:hypothetical protein